VSSAQPARFMNSTLRRRQQTFTDAAGRSEDVPKTSLHLDAVYRQSPTAGIPLRAIGIYG
jgi:hypothetical protein